MSADVFITDTHPLIWYFANKHAKLSKKVKSVFERAVLGESLIYVPAPALWELSALSKSGKIALSKSIDELISNRYFAKAIISLSMEDSDVVIAHHLTFTNDPFDTMIVAMAIKMDCPLITNDTHIHKSHPCKLFW